VDITVDEIVRDLELLQSIDTGTVEQRYEKAISLLDATNDQNRGSATTTAVIASYLAALCRDATPDKAMQIAANVLGSDTDSIATMAGAILGGCSDLDVPYSIQDRNYLIEEAARLAAISDGVAKKSFGYPDLRKWKPQRTAVDVISVADDGLFVNGIARAENLGGPTMRESQDIQLAWLRLSFGQTILARMRNNPNRVANIEEYVVTERDSPRDRSRESNKSTTFDLFAASKVKESIATQSKQVPKTLNEILNDVIASNFDAETIGKYILQQAERNNSDFVERSIALTANIITAYRARIRK